MSVEQAMATELLIDRATVGLPPAQETELASLLERFPELDDDSFELAAAAIDLAHTIPNQPMPAALRQRVADQAARHFATTHREPQPENVTPFPAERAVPRARADASRWLGWLAAAACLALVFTVWRPAPQPSAANAACAALIARAGDVLQIDWTATEDPAARGASGDVVWSNLEQAGYMRFRGLAVNDPAVEQYQLWIFDAQQDERFPIDGGVFDVTATGEVVVPIDPKISVVEPTLFAVTVEKPGGVVVSSRERLPLLAKVAS